MKKNKTYDWSKLPPPENNYVQVNFTPKQKERINKCSAILKEVWGIDEQVARNEIKSIYIDHKFAYLYLLGNEERLKILKELTKLHNFINGVEVKGTDTLILKVSKKNKQTGKIEHNKLTLKSDFIIKRILKYCKTLQDASIISKVGRPSVSSTDIQRKKFCARTLNDRYLSIITSQRDRCYFIGIIIIAAGIFSSDTGLPIEQKANIKPENKDKVYLITKVKKLL